MTLKPKKLNKSDKVALISPSGFATKENINIAIENIKSLGLKVFHTDRIFAKHGYLAGTDEQRLADLHEAFENDEIKAIFCIRGGYGATRLLEKINYDIIRKNPKILVGFSDITALHSAFLQKTGLTAIHGIVASSEFTDYTRKQLNDVLFNSLKTYNLPCNWNNIIAHGSGKGTSVGGNLSLLVSLIGSEFIPSFEQKVVFIEEVAETPYKIDRMLTHLLTATDLKKAEAIIFGTFYKCSPEENNTKNENSLTVEQIIEEKFSDFNKPVLNNVNFGHIKNACIFPIGVETCVNTEMQEIFVLENFIK